MKQKIDFDTLYGIFGGSRAGAISKIG